jgi:4-diphosphocytidyl-2-C-methyl-D-erythritol kinase
MNLRAYAKINIGLHVVGKRSDGYHNIETVFRLIDMYDDLELVPSDAGNLFFSDNPLLKNDSSNLCIKAASLLRELTGVREGVSISLKKRIPIGAGLGGGSSDAAAVLRGLTKLWSLDLSMQELQTMSVSLGSDVPFFLSTQTAYATGRGELLTPMPLNIPYWILTATPDIHVATAWAYSNVTLSQSSPDVNLRDLLSASVNRPEILRSVLRNDFEGSVLKEFAGIAALKRLLLEGGAEFALMSGSGSSVFGFFSSRETVMRLKTFLSTKYVVSVTEPQFTPENN